MSNAITKRATAALLSNAPESGSLDYKLGFYEATESGRKEFGKDISGFANKGGGMLIIGVREENGQPKEIAGIDPSKIDASLLWLESVARTSVAPHLNLLSASAFEHEGKQLIVVDVPRGLNPPYEVPAAGARFFVRDERSTRPMSREELRAAVLQGPTLSNRIADFCNSCWTDLVTGVAPKIVTTRGGAQLVVFPVFDGSFDFRFDLPTVAQKIPHVSSLSLREVASARPFIDGLTYTFSEHKAGEFAGFVRLFRHGAIQFADADMMAFDSEQRQQTYPGALLMSGLLGSIARAIKFSQGITGASSFVVDFRVLTKPGMKMAFYSNSYGFTENEKVDRSYLGFDPLSVNTDEGWEENLPQLCRPLLDQIWQSFGYVNCGYFDSNGQYQQRR